MGNNANWFSKYINSTPNFIGPLTEAQQKEDDELQKYLKMFSESFSKYPKKINEYTNTVLPPGYTTFSMEGPPTFEQSGVYTDYNGNSIHDPGESYFLTQSDYVPTKINTEAKTSIPTQEVAQEVAKEVVGDGVGRSIFDPPPSQATPATLPKQPSFLSNNNSAINYITKQLNEGGLNEKTRYDLEQKYKEYTGKDFDYPWYTDTSNWLKNAGNTIWDMITPDSINSGNMTGKDGKDNSLTSEEQTRILNDQSKNLQNEWLLKNPILGPENKPEGFVPQVETPVEQMYDIQKGDTISELLWKNRKGGIKIKDLYNFINQQKDWGQYGIGNDPNKIYAGKQMNLQKLLRDFETYITR